MKRIYLGTEWIKKRQNCLIKGDTFHYLKNVLRFKEGDIFKGFDGTGKEYEIKIKKIKKERIEGEIINEVVLFSTEPKFSLCLFQCIPKGNKMDFIIREITQLGVKKIVPVISKRTVVKVYQERIENKIKRWEKIAGEAAKISGRSLIPEIDFPVNFEDAIKEKKDYGIVFWEGETEFSIKDFIKDLKKEKVIGSRFNVFIGPEGGFDEDEIKIAKDFGFNIVSLGRRILKVETASVVAVAILMYEFENLIS